MTLLSITDLAIDAGPLSLIDGVRLDVAPGEVVALVGESGSGKSLTALSIMGLLADGLSVTRGRIEFNGVDLTQLSQEGLRALRGEELGRAAPHCRPRPHAPQRRTAARPPAWIHTPDTRASCTESEPMLSLYPSHARANRPAHSCQS